MSQYDWIQPGVKALVVAKSGQCGALDGEEVILSSAAYLIPAYGVMVAEFEGINDMAQRLGLPQPMDGSQGQFAIAAEHLRPIKDDKLPDWENIATSGDQLTDDDKFENIVDNIEELLH